jgi:hypothetical protein
MGVVRRKRQPKDSALSQEYALTVYGGEALSANLNPIREMRVRERLTLPFLVEHQVVLVPIEWMAASLRS